MISSQWNEGSSCVVVRVRVSVRGSPEQERSCGTEV